MNGKRIFCQTCGVLAGQLNEYGRAVGWYRLQLERPRTEGDIRSGSYCSPDCLLTAVMASYGLTAEAVRSWLTEGASA